MSRWYFPSWNGDLRLEADGEDADKTRLYIEKPTLDEVRIVNLIGAECLKEKWLAEWEEFKAPEKGLFRRKSSSILIGAPLEKVGPVVTAIMRPGPAVLTAIKFSNGRVETTSGSTAELQALAATAYRGGPEKEALAVSEDDKAALALAKKKDEKPTAAATVKRPTPSCPQCMPGSIDPAREVLLAFLTPEEHESWAKSRTIVVEGGLTGHRYMLAHRHTKQAQQFGRCCFDLDTQCVVHFHDWSVPPEEEILAAKLILEHREPWLRNEATMLDVSGLGYSTMRSRPDAMIFKNPFGDGMDGVADAGLSQSFGLMMAGMLGVPLDVSLEAHIAQGSIDRLAEALDRLVAFPRPVFATATYPMVGGGYFQLNPATPKRHIDPETGELKD